MMLVLISAHCLTRKERQTDACSYLKAHKIWKLALLCSSGESNLLGPLDKANLSLQGPNRLLSLLVTHHCVIYGARLFSMYSHFYSPTQLLVM
jgi:hypothetical protein